jgi:type IV pilus assembly protein PilZ
LDRQGTVMLQETISKNTAVAVDIELRTNRRLPIRVMVEYETTEDFLIDYTANVSIGGMFIKTSKPLTLGTRFRIRFRLPNRSKPIESYAIVRWSVSPEKAGCMEAGMGVQFEELGRRDFTYVEEMVQTWEYTDD